MSTRSAIIEKLPGSKGYRGIYCHSDGYLSYNGRMLLQHWTEPAKVRALIDLGDISCLGEAIGEKHPFDKHHTNEQTANWTLAYMRDRGEKGFEPKYGTLDAVVSRLLKSDAEFFYVFDGKGSWKYSECQFPMSFSSLTLENPSVKKMIADIANSK